MVVLAGLILASPLVDLAIGRAVRLPGGWMRLRWQLSAGLGALETRLPDGAYAPPYVLARALTLVGAVASEVEPIDTVFPAYRDHAGLRRECAGAARDGFTGKMAIHPDQVAVINELFTPSPEAVARARAIVAAFAAAPGAGVIGVEGDMLDRPHLKRAERLLARIG